MNTQKKTSLSLKQKLRIIADATESNKNELCAKYGCCRSTLNRLLRNQEIIIEKSKTCNLTIKRFRSGACPDVERALTVWFNQMRQSAAIVSSNMVLEKAKQFAIKMKKDFNPTAGWLWRWQKREGISFKKIHGGGSSVDVGALPTSSLSRKGHQISGFDAPKERLTMQPSSVSNCFKKTKFISDDADIKEDIEDVRCSNTMDNLLSDEHIDQEFIMKEEYTNTDEEDDLIENAPSLQEALTSLSILRKYFLSTSKFASELESMEDYMLSKLCTTKKVQTKITEFFH